MSKWKETNKYGIRESKAAYRHYTRRRDKEAEILKELEPNSPTHVDLTGFEDYIQRLREPKEPTMDDNFLIWFDVETSGLDLHCIEDFHIDGLGRITVGTGIAIDLPEGYMARVCPRSGLARNYGIDILGGIIDAGYRGEIKVILHNTSTSRVNFRCGDRIAQLVITPVETPRIRKVVNFTDTTERGGNGFGSTGR